MVAGLVRLLDFMRSTSKNLVNGQQYGEEEQHARDPGPAVVTQLTELSVIAERQTEARSWGAQARTGNDAAYNSCSTSEFSPQNTRSAYWNMATNSGLSSSESQSENQWVYITDSKNLLFPISQGYYC